MGGFMSQETEKKYPKFELNNPISAVHANIEANIRRPLPQVQPHDEQSQAIGLICGGPSLNDHTEELQSRYAEGMRFVSVNGTHDWLLEHGMHPSAHVMVDSRRKNAKFVRHWDKRCKYLIASQCHPQVFKTLDKANVYIWHAACGPTELGIISDHYLGQYYVSLGGSTVTLRALSILRMLGFSRIEIWGFDSCCRGDEHHAYEQSEHDKYRKVDLEIEGKQFRCEVWMHSQAKEFQDLTKSLGGSLELVVHGDGLIAHMVKTGASLSDLQEK